MVAPLAALALFSAAACTAEDPNQLIGGRTGAAVESATGNGVLTSAASSADDAPNAGSSGASSSGSSGTSSSGSTGTDAGSSGTSSGSTGTDAGSSGTSSSGSSGTSSGSSGTDAGPLSAEEICVATINDYRKTKGLPALARWTAAETCSDGEATSDSISKTPHGAFGQCGEWAQNECPGWPGPANTMIPGCLATMWAEGPGGGHYENMVATRYTQVACGFATAPSGGGVWAVQNFR